MHVHEARRPYGRSARSPDLVVSGYYNLLPLYKKFIHKEIAFRRLTYTIVYGFNRFNKLITHQQEGQTALQRYRIVKIGPWVFGSVRLPNGRNAPRALIRETQNVPDT